jgi:transposase
LLWEEYRAAHGEQAYGYARFCALYRQWACTQALSMRQVHIAGEKLFVDYAGPTVEVLDDSTGEIRTAQIFVAVLGASNYTYVEATWSQSLPDWIGAHTRAFAFFGGVPRIVVPDNLKSAVSQPCRYEPTLSRSYQEMAEHYGIAIIPARPHKPKDKAKVEVGVQIVERWVLAKLRHRQFTTLSELNQTIAELTQQLNAKPFKRLPGSRASQFAELDQPALQPLPADAYTFAQWKAARVNIDYHVELDGHYYSVPYRHARQTVEIRYTVTMVEIFHERQRIASHARRYRKGAHTTLGEHMPKAHRAQQDWTPGRLLNWGQSIGPQTVAVVRWQLECKPHPEMGYRACLGLLSLAKRYGKDRLEAACERAWRIGSPTRKSVISILQKGLDQQPLLPLDARPAPPAHGNIRGADYYH